MIKTILADLKPSSTELSVVFVSTLGWLIALWVINYPVEDWIGVVLIAYGAHVVSRLVIADIVLRPLSSRLTKYATQVAYQLSAHSGISVEEIRNTGKKSHLVKGMLAVFMLAWITTTVGLLLLLMSLILRWAGLPPLGSASNAIAMWLFGLGGVGMFLHIAGTYATLRNIDKAVSGQKERSEVRLTAPLLATHFASNIADSNGKLRHLMRITLRRNEFQVELPLN